MQQYDYHGHDRIEVQDAIDKLAESLTDALIPELEFNAAGFYLTKDRWVSMHDFGQALIDAYTAGRQG